MLGRMADIASKFRLPPRFGTPSPSVWLDMQDLESKHKAVNLGLGYPDYGPPKHVTDALADVANTDNFMLHQYTKGFGHPRLVNILSTVYSKLINRNIDPNTEMLVSEGAQQSLYNIFNGLLDEGDEVILIEPFFEPYEPMIHETGAILKYIPLRYKNRDSKVLSTNDFYLDKNELENMFNANTKLIVVNTPNNPLGKVYNMEEMQMIADLCIKWNVICVADEVYEWLVYKPYEHIRMASLPGMWNRTLTVGSAGKTFSITGWRTGWTYGPAYLMNNLKVVHQNCIYTHLTPIQEAIAMVFENEYDLMINNPKECYFYTLRDELTSKREFMMKAFSDVGLKPIEPQGGYMMLVDVSELESKADLSQETDKYKDIKMAKWLTKRGLMGLPVSPFYSKENKSLAKSLLRFCFIKQDEKLQEAAKVLQTLK